MFRFQLSREIENVLVIERSEKITGRRMSSSKKGLACVKPADISTDSHSISFLSKDPSFA